MKTYKCKSCGANLDVDEKKKYVTCKYCDTKYSIEELTKDPQAQVVKGIGTFFAAFSFVGVIMVLIPIIIFGIIIAVAINATNKEDFNFYFKNGNGSQPTLFVEEKIDKVIDSNNKNKRKISVKYQDKETTDVEEIRNIKNSLDKSRYDVVYEYDDKGYIKTVKIEEINK